MNAAAPEVLDCRSCSSAGSVVRGVCEICWDHRPVEIDAAVPLRFSDVMSELSSVASLAELDGEDGRRIAAACRRLERMFALLRDQFLADVGLPAPPI